MAVEYVRSVDESSKPSFRHPFGNSESIPTEEQYSQSLGYSSLRGSTGNSYHNFHPSRTPFDQQTLELNDNASQSCRRQSLQISSDRRSSLISEVEKRMRRSSLPNPAPKNVKPQRRVVGNGVYKLETLPWHESSLRQAVARRAHERKDQLASPLPLINLRPEAEARLRDVLGEDGYTDWKRKHRVSYLLNEG